MCDVIDFDPANPFPLLDEGAYSYQAEKAHAASVDLWLGLDTKVVEASLSQPFEAKQDWRSKGPEVFLTPYTEVRRMFCALPLLDSDSVADIGAGYGRIAFVLHRHWPQVDFVGLELRNERVMAANSALEHFGSRHRLQCQDVASAGVPEATVYFIYDFGTLLDVEVLLNQLKAIARTKKFKIMARGRLVRDCIDRGQPWLWAEKHFSHFSIYHC